VCGIPTVRLLLAHVAGSDLGCISDPHFVSQPIQQVLEPLRVATRLKTNPYRRTQPTVETRGFAVAVFQLPLADLSRF